MVETQVMAAATSVALHRDEREYVVAFQEVLCVAGVATASGDSRDLEEVRQMHVMGNFGRSSPEELYFILHLKCHGTV